MEFWTLEDFKDSWRRDWGLWFMMGIVILFLVATCAAIVAELSLPPPNSSSSSSRGDGSKVSGGA